MGDEDSKLPSKVYFRIGEVASLVGVEPHVLRYWEREFRTIRPKKSARGQRVYSRKDVETLMRVRQLLYAEGFTIAGARRRLQQERSNNGAGPLVVPHDETSASGAERVATSNELAGHAVDGLSGGALVDGAFDGESRSQSNGSDRSETYELPLPFFASHLHRESNGAGAREVSPTVRNGGPRALPTPAFVEPPPSSERLDRGVMRTTLRDLRGEIEAFLAELG